MRTLSIILILMFSIPATAQAANNADQAKSPSAESKVTSSASDSWSQAERRFWETRAAETRLINGELWSVRVQLEGERLAAIDTPAMQARALAYQQPGAPNHIRLRDGKQARSLAEVVQTQGIEGVVILQGQVASVEDGVLKLRLAKAKWGYSGIATITGLSADDAAAFREQILTDEQKNLLNQHGHTTPHCQVIVKKEKAKDGSYQLATPTAEAVSPEALRAFCAKHHITAWPDLRPVLQNRLVLPPANQLGPGEKLQLESKWKREQYDRQDFAWHAHPLIIPPAFR